MTTLPTTVPRYHDTFEKILFGAEVSKVCVLPESLLLVSGTSWYNTTTHHCTSTLERPADQPRQPGHRLPSIIALQSIVL